MTNRARLTVPQDFPIQAAENEGMPPRPDFEDTQPRFTRPGSQTGTHCLGSLKEKTATGKAWPAREKPIRQDKKKNNNSLARLISRLAVVAGIIASVAFPVFAQDGTGPMPDNAEARNYGGGWDCDLGFRVEGAECMALDIPDNAYATGRTYGSGWACRRGYEEISGASCEAIPIPENAYLRSTGHDWQCDRGYRQDRETCVPIVLPEHGYLTEDTSGSEWVCDRGFTPSASACIPIAVLENGYLTNSDYGAEWACERGVFEIDGRCDPVALPANAFLDQESYGPGWRCERRFEAVDNACVAIDLPANAHLDRSGNRWRCDRSFQLSDGACVLGR
ncbi:hypothetical protein [Donghicola tyrosinivorans]|uniref:MSP1 EGF domain 1 n=1 Tax=Donghicola tyrosinivorans TaxID=1652492 RepID=A0A2T0WCE2_9RHOB|nr:hypothetical protein [Donghicola tyrosinivorans]PRY84368.1 hypothetical protein CLV74_12537 [Donghicola tyrosinivorans]